MFRDSEGNLVVLTSTGFILWFEKENYITCPHCKTVKAVVENRGGATWCSCGGRINGSKST